MNTYGVMRGPRGAMEPEDRVRVDAAIETAETINARIGEATEAAEIATEAAAATDADAQATEAGRQQAVQAAGDAQAARAAAEAARLLAEQERQAAEAAAVAAALRAGYYDTIAAGRAAVADGETFAVRAGGTDGLVRPTIYRRDSATTQTAMVTIVNPSEVDAEVAERTAVAGTLARVHEDGRYARSGVDYAEVGADRRPILHHARGVRVYDMPVRATGEFDGAHRGTMTGTVNGITGMDEPDRWSRSGVDAVIIGANRRVVQSAVFTRLIEDPDRYARSGYDAAMVGKDRRIIVDLRNIGGTDPEPAPAAPAYLPWSDGAHVYVDRQDSGETLRVSQGGASNTDPRMQGEVVIWQSDRPAGGAYDPAALGGLYYSSPDRADEHPVIPLPWLACFGDSTTANGWPSQLSGLGWGIPVMNFGRSGNTARGIASRFWAIETSYDCPLIPGTATEVECVESASSLGKPMESYGNASATCHGYITASPDQDPATGAFVILRWDLASAKFYIRRYAAGADIQAGKWYFWTAPTAGNTPAPTAEMAWRFQDAILVLLIGRNSAQDPHGVFDMAQMIVAKHRPLSKRMVLMPWIHATDEGIGTSGYALRQQAMALFRAAWPDNTLDIVPYLQAAASDSPDDLDALARDVPPPSLMLDRVHPNALGQVEQARAVLEFCTQKGWR